MSTGIAEVASQQHLSVFQKVAVPLWSFLETGQEIRPDIHCLAIDQLQLLDHLGILSVVG